MKQPSNLTVVNFNTNHLNIIEKEIATGILNCISTDDEEKLIEGLSILENVADKSEKACYVLGKILATKTNDHEKAYYYMLQAAKKNYNLAMQDLGAYYELGFGVKKNIEKAIYWYELASKMHNNPVTLYTLGRLNFEGNEIERNYERVYSWYRASADCGYADACAILGNMYYEGVFVGQNYDTASFWYEKAYDFGNKKMAYTLGTLYLTNNKILSDDELALDWFFKGHENGLIDCTYGLGLLYYDGIEGYVDYEKALQYFMISGQEGIAEGCLEAAIMFMDGIGTVRNILIAKEWLKKAIDFGDRGLAIELLKKLERKNDRSSTRIENHSATVNTYFKDSYYTGMEAEIKKQKNEERITSERKTNLLRAASAVTKSKTTFYDEETGIVFDEDMKLAKIVDVDTGLIFGCGGLAQYDEKSKTTYNFEDGSISYFISTDHNGIGDSSYNLTTGEMSIHTGGMTTKY